MMFAALIVAAFMHNGVILFNNRNAQHKCRHYYGSNQT